MTTPRTVRTGEILSVAVDDLPAEDLAPGIRVRALPGMPGIRTWVIDLDPGAEWPEPDVHAAYGEAYFVVAGEIIEGEHTHGPGTYVAFGAGTGHRPRTETGVRAFGFNYDV
ncbi:anti-sigma factor [Streptomyces sp. RFCAC02]|uniref:anti-sigma factor n=1 Tax=Streptomyces sp. RFCAC02 TaxID=2499143 RepID=UPI00101F31DA|nr:anti-sigma factor [Streptomyces sp. RFCAC02]